MKRVLTVFAVVMSFTPGPNNILLTASGVPGGKAHTIAHAIATERSGSGGGGAVARAAQLSFISALNEILMVACVIAFTGAVLGALLVESRRRRAGTPVLALLALAGLLRPEAWAFSAVYLLYLLYGRAAQMRRSELARWAVEHLAS